MNVAEFIEKWRRAELTERSAGQQHFLDLCDLLDHPKPAEVDPKGEFFTFERGATKKDGSDGWADVWNKDYFAWEYKGPHKDLQAAYLQLALPEAGTAHAAVLPSPPLPGDRQAAGGLALRPSASSPNPRRGAPMTRGHANPRRSEEEPLSDPDVPTPTHAERARTLLASLKTGALATVASEPEGHPYASFITFAVDRGEPIFLISEMAEHTQNLRRDPRASLLAAESRSEDPLANGRVTFLGTCRPVEGNDTSARAAYLERLPNAEYYCDFKDFHFWRLRVDSVRYIGGYGRMSWVAGDEWRAAEPDPLAEHAEGIVEHMNQDHADAMAVLCRAFTRAGEAEEVTMTGIDRYGFEMSVVTERGPRPARLAFPETVETPEEARKALVAMVGEARSALG